MTGARSHTLDLSGDAGLRNAPAIAVQLRQTVADQGAITIRTDALTGADITTLQLLVAARKSALAAGKTLTLQAPRDGVLARLLVQAGFLDAAGRPLTPDGEFWAKTSTMEQAA